MNTKMKNIIGLNLEELEKVNGGTEMDAQTFLAHLSKKYGVITIREIKKHWTQEEKDYFDRAYKRKQGEEPLGPYPD